MSQTVPVSSWLEILRWVIRRRRTFRVTGESMRPTLMPGWVVLIDFRAYRDELPEIGDVVVARHPFQDGLLLIKRVADFAPATGSDGRRIVLHSDNPAQGTDSRSFGPVWADQIVGKVTSRLSSGGD